MRGNIEVGTLAGQERSGSERRRQYDVPKQTNHGLENPNRVHVSIALEITATIGVFRL